MVINYLKQRFKKPQNDLRYRSLWQYIHIDIILVLCLALLFITGLSILYSASNQSLNTIEKQALHVGFAFIVMITVAQIPPATLQRWAPFIYIVSISLLIAVLVIGHISKGAQRWLTIGFLRFQPAELLKLAIPMFLAWYYHRIHLPISTKTALISLPIILIPVIITAKQPDLGTAIVLLIAGSSVLFLAGLSWRLISLLGGILILCLPLVWWIMYDYQRQRVLTFFSPDRDPLGKGYHIIQSKIAIGSGGLFGKGWLNGTQSHLHFLPEHTTDFIFAVCGEEFGFIGCIILLFLYTLVIARGWYITLYAQDTFSRLLAGSITLSFFVAFFVNMGMVTGILPVVGLPLPFISYGGSSVMMLMVGFGILMSIQTHKKLMTT